MDGFAVKSEISAADCCNSLYPFTRCILIVTDVTAVIKVRSSLQSGIITYVYGTRTVKIQLHLVELATFLVSTELELVPY